MAYNYGLAPGTTHKVSPSGSSAAASTAFNADTVFVRIAASADMHIAFAATPTAAVTDLFIPADTVEIIKVPLVLEASDALKATMSSTDSTHIGLSYLVIT